MPGRERERERKRDRERRGLFLTIGNSPRTDILDEMRPWWESGPTRSCRLLMEESGALDDLDANAIRSLAPAPGARQLVSRLSSGDEVHLDADAIEERLVRIANDRWRKTRPDFIVVLCTGEFPRIEVGCPLVSSGKIVDSAVDAFSRASSRTGVLVPHPSQMEGFRDRFRHPPFLTSYASPYSGDRFEKAAQELEECDLVIMHCMGYDEEMRERVSRVTEKPVLLARRLVAAAVAQLL